MKTIIRFLTNCYELAIVVGFIGSILAWLGLIIIWLVALTIHGHPSIGLALGVAGAIVIFTFIEFAFLIALGASAILVDIRNELVLIKGEQ